MGGLAHRTLSPPCWLHTSLMRGQHKTTGFRLLRLCSLAPVPGDIPISASSTSKDLLNVKPPCNYQCPGPQPSMLFGESSLAPSPGLPKAGRANTLLRASCLKPLCPHSAHPDCSARPHSAVSCHLYTHLHSMCLHVPAASPRGPTSRGYAGASLGSDGQVHS